MTGSSTAGNWRINLAFSVGGGGDHPFHKEERKQFSSSPKSWNRLYIYSFQFLPRKNNPHSSHYPHPQNTEPHVKPTMGETTSTLWYRKFLRTADNDQDFPVDAAVKRELHDDFFADFLQNHGGDEILCLDDLLRRFYGKNIYTPHTYCANNTTGKPDKYTFNIYAVADGAFIKDPIRDKVGEMTLKPWFNPHIRFVAVVHPTAVPPSGDKWTIFIVGSNELHSKERFLQVASWDPSIDEYRFFGVSLHCRCRYLHSEI